LLVALENAFAMQGPMNVKFSGFSTKKMNNAPYRRMKNYPQKSFQKHVFVPQKI